MSRRDKLPSSARLEKIVVIIRIIQHLASSANGVSIAILMEEYGITRRTLERYMNVIKALYPYQFEEISLGCGRKAFRIQSLYRHGPVALTAHDLTILSSAVTLAERYKMTDLVLSLKVITHKLGALSKRNIQRNAEDMAENITTSMLAGPISKISLEISTTIEQAIAAWRKLRIEYTIRKGDRQISCVVCPYGILYGSRPYLVARVNDKYRLFALSNFKQVQITDETFIRDEQFSLRQYARSSFGTFQEKPQQVIWKVSRECAQEALNFIFHPTQKLTLQPDGSVLIEFTAGGFKEMCWHLFTWEGEIEIIDPPELQQMMQEMLLRFNRHNGKD